MFLCVRGIVVPSQESERSCFCVRGIVVPSQESERSCFCVLGVSLYQARKLSDHVFVC
jgi:hypothetical protein